MKKSVAVITGLQCADNPSPGVAVARSLKAKGVATIGVAYSPLDTGAHMPGLFDHVVYFQKPDEQKLDSYFHQFYDLMVQFQPDMILPTLDPEIPLFSKHNISSTAPKLPVLLPSPETLKKTHKLNISKFCNSEAFKIPKQEIAYCIADVNRAIGRFGLPCMIKGQWYEAYEINHFDEVPYFFRKLKMRWQLPVVIQQKISGSEVTFVGLCDQNSQLIHWGMIRKWGISEQGKTWCAVSFTNDKYTAAIQSLLSDLKWVGPCEIEFFMDEATGELTLFEFNMRLPSWIYLGAEAGVNFPFQIMNLIKDIHNEPSCFESGKVFVRVVSDYVVPMSRILTLQNKGQVHGET